MTNQCSTKGGQTVYYIIYIIFKRATIWTFRKISDFLKHRPGTWYEVDNDGNIIFNDGPDDLRFRETKDMKNIRYQTKIHMAAIWSYIYLKTLIKHNITVECTT